MKMAKKKKLVKEKRAKKRQKLAFFLKTKREKWQL